jgi:hypothetical protein
MRLRGVMLQLHIYRIFWHVDEDYVGVGFKGSVE